MRNLLNDSPLLDRWVGDPLRRLEATLGLSVMGESVAPNPVSCHGFALHYGPGEKRFVTTMVFYDDYEPQTREAVESLLAPGMTFIDLGAHIGYYTLIAARTVGTQGRVFAFEPNPRPRTSLEKNVAENGFTARVRVVPCAIWDSQRRLHFCADPTYSDAGHLVAGGDAIADSFEVDAVSLDSFLEREDWPAVHLVKMDVEGAEFAAIKGMRSTIERNPGLRIIFEFNRDTLPESASRPEDLFRLLQASGFKRFRILYRHADTIVLPGDMKSLIDLARRANVNILASQD